MISQNGNSRHSGFTLIELLVAITIMLILVGMTVGVVSLAINTDRIPSTARTIQAGLMGARDRALRAGSTAATGENPRRGIRFVVNPNQPNAISSLLYVGNQEDWTQGKITIATSMSLSTITPTIAWPSAFSDPFLVNARIWIKDSGSGTWYRLNNASTLTRPFSSADGDYDYRLQLPSSILPNEQPLTLDSNIVINLQRSQVPANWDGEILFNPDGKVYGPLAAQGPIYLYLCTIDDFLGSTAGSSLAGRDSADPAAGETLIIKINTQNGRFQTFPVDPTDSVNNTTQMAPPDGLADKPFRFAEQQ